MKKFFPFPDICTDDDINSIKTIESYDQINFDNITNPETLVLFDVDDTLIEPEDTYVINKSSEVGLQFRKFLITKYPEIKDLNYIDSIIIDQAERNLIEKQVIDKINILKKNNIDVFAITALRTGKFYSIERMEEWRYNHLKNLGFEGTYQNDIFYLDGFKTNPIFYKGIIATDLEYKGEVLTSVLSKMNIAPKKIIMFDDNLEFLDSVKKSCRQNGISFFGYRYNGAASKEWDEELISFQIDYLIKHKKWLSDTKAKEKLKELK